MLHVTPKGRSRFSIKLEELTELRGALTKDSSVNETKEGDITTNGQRGKAEVLRREAQAL
eukprot:12831860-Alexandrium_andersonii.AAC.1